MKRFWLVLLLTLTSLCPQMSGCASSSTKTSLPTPNPTTAPTPIIASVKIDLSDLESFELNMARFDPVGWRGYEKPTIVGLNWVKEYTRLGSHPLDEYYWPGNPGGPQALGRVLGSPSEGYWFDFYAPTGPVPCSIIEEPVPERSDVVEISSPELKEVLDALDSLPHKTSKSNEVLWNTYDLYAIAKNEEFSAIFNKYLDRSFITWSNLLRQDSSISILSLALTLFPPQQLGKYGVPENSWKRSLVLNRLLEAGIISENATIEAPQMAVALKNGFTVEDLAFAGVPRDFINAYK